MKLNFLHRKKRTPKHMSQSDNVSNDIEKFVIVSIPRTGSNLLCGALDAHPEIICHYELFHKEAIYYSSKYGNEWMKTYSVQKRNDDPNAFLDFIFSHRFGKTAKTIGYKIFAGHNDELLKDLISDKKVKKIILKRDNLFMAYLSHLEAQKTGVFVVKKENNDNKTKYNFKVNIDLNKFKHFEKHNKSFFINIENKLKESTQNYITLEYQSVLELENRLKMLKFLEVKPDPDLLKIEYIKLNIRKLEDRIENYSEIIEKFSGTENEHYLF